MTGDFDQNLSSDEFVNFAQNVLELSVHMVLNDPVIELGTKDWKELIKSGQIQ